MIARLKSVHSTSAAAPKIISVFGTAPPSSARIFSGQGAPTAGTLPAGNGKFNGLTGGYVLSVSIANAGANYKDGDQLTDNTIQIIVDLVDANGGIVDCHVAAAALYAPYPPGPVQVNGGSGAGASFNFNTPPADIYCDVTTLTSPVTYICTAGGNPGTWAQIGGGGGGYAGEYNSQSTYSGGTIVTKSSGSNQGTWAVKPGMTATSSTPIAFPPAPTSPWVCLALGFQIVGACGAVGEQDIYANASGPF